MTVLHTITSIWFLQVNYNHSFVYSSGQFRRWPSCIQAQIESDSVLASRVISNLAMRNTLLNISCTKFSLIGMTKLNLHAMAISDSIKDFVSPHHLFVSRALIVTSTWPPMLTAHCPIGQRHYRLFIGHWRKCTQQNFQHEDDIHDLTATLRLSLWTRYQDLKLQTFQNHCSTEG